MKLIKSMAQVLGLCFISLIGNQISAVLQIGIPGSIVGLLLLLFLLERKWIAIESVELGANFLIAELLLFFIPSAIGVIQFQDVLRKDWTQLLLVIEASIFFVLLFVAVATEMIVRRKERGSAS